MLGSNSWNCSLRCCLKYGMMFSVEILDKQSRIYTLVWNECLEFKVSELFEIFPIQMLQYLVSYYLFKLHNKKMVVGIRTIPYFSNQINKYYFTLYLCTYYVHAKNPRIYISVSVSFDHDAETHRHSIIFSNFGNSILYFVP